MATQIGFQDEALRRMARRAGVTAVAKASKGNASVDDQLRKIAKSIVEKLCERLVIICSHHKTQTITPAILSHTLDGLYNHDHYPDFDGAFPPCKSFKAATAKAKAKAKAKAAARGSTAEKEAKHESKHEDCLYNEGAPFLRLVRAAMHEQHTDVRFTASALSYTQFVVESLLIKILRMAGSLVKELTAGPRGGKGRATVNQKDVLAAVRVLKECTPLLKGFVEEIKVAKDPGPIDDAPGAASGRGGRGRGRGRGGSSSRGGGRARGGTSSRGSGRARGNSRGGRTAAPRVKQTARR